MASNVPITELQGQIPIRRKGDIKCSVHRNKDLILHCTDCNVLICLSCSLSTHSGHALTELSDIALQKKDVLQDFLHDVEDNKLILLKNEMQSIEKQISENDKNFKELGHQVKTQGEVCKKQIDVLTDEVVSICENLKRENRDLLIKYKEGLQKRYKSLLEQVRECKEILQTGTDVLVCDSASDLSADFFQAKSAPVLHEAEFHPCTEITEQLRKTLGVLNTSSGPPSASSEATTKLSTLLEELKDEPIVLTRFKSPIHCTTICSTTSGTWLCDNESTVLILVGAKGQIKQGFKYPDSNIMDISTSQTGSLWFCCTTNFSINEVQVATHSLVPITRFVVDTWPTSICVTQDGNVVVGTRNAVNAEGKLSIYTTDGQLMHSNSVHKKRYLLGTPFPISECSVTGRFAVTSWEKENDDGPRSSNVLVFDGELKFRFAIGDHGTKQNCPWGAVYDSKGHLLVAFNNAVKLLSGTGQYLKTIINDFGGCDVIAIGVQPDCILYVHFHTYKIEKRRMIGKLLKKRSDPALYKSEIITLKYYRD